MPVGKSPEASAWADNPEGVSRLELRPQLQRTALICFALLMPLQFCRSAETQATALASDARSLSVIFGGELSSDIKGARMSSARLPTDQRYEFLLSHVLPKYDDRVIRIEIDFAPATPSPVTAQLLNLPTPSNSSSGRSAGTRLMTGSDLISPAIDLVDVARELGRLEELRRRVNVRRPDGNDGEHAQLALLALIKMSAGDFDSAYETIGKLHVSIADSPVNKAERGAVAAVIWASLRHREMVEAARDLTFLAYEQARNQLGPRSERWHRQLYSMKHALQRLVETRKSKQADVKKSNPLRNWIPVSRMTDETCGKGYPLAGWETSTGSATHVTCHDHDYLMYAVPLSGDFEVEADLTTFGYRDIQLAAGGFWAGPGYDHAALLNGNFHAEHPTFRLKPKLTRMLDWMRVRIVVKDGQRTTFINGRNVLSRPHPAGSDPWIAIHSPWYTNGAVRDLRVRSDEEVPAEIDLAGTPDIPGWLPYFDESAGHDDANWRIHPQPDGSTFLQGRRQWGMNGSFFESLLRYHRPVAEDGVISYDYFYSPDQLNVHPSLGRLAFLLEPSGVKIHWITDGRFESTGLDPANAIEELANRRGPTTLSLKRDDWNNVQLEIAGNVARLSLNNQLVYERTLEATNQRTFGLFHYADRSEARVRNVRWRGDWPRNLPAARHQELADRTINDIDAHRESLTARFTHNFAEGLPRSEFNTLNSGEKLQVEENSDGVRVTRPGSEGWPNTSLVPKLKVHGDFDITAEFADFTSRLDDGGSTNLQLFVELHDEQHTECRLSRSRKQKSATSDEDLAQAAFFRGPADKRGYDFFASPAEEATSGKIRLARRDNQLHFLFAEDDSPFFRLLASRPVSTSSSRSYGVRLMLETPRGEESSVTWKNLDVRAESLTGAALAPSYSFAELNQQRSRLPILLEHDFATNESLKPFLIWGTHGEFNSDSEGLKVTVPGADEWLAAGLAPKLELAGDFDVSLGLEVLQIDKAAENHESSVYLETELDDELQTAVEIKFAVSSNGVQTAAMQLRRRQPDGQTAHRVLGSREVKGVNQLRLARRGSIMYLIFQSSPDEKPQIVTTADVGTAPVPATFLRALIRTGGADVETVVRFRSLRIRSQSDSPSG